MSAAPKPYNASVLAIQTPISVTLARRKIELADVLSLAAGSMLTFDMHCDHPLTLEAAGTPIATGETVKIGDKFGIRLREITNHPQ